MPYLYWTDNLNFIPYTNKKDSVTITNYTQFSTRDKNVKSGYNIENEPKYYQYPYRKNILIYKNNKYDISPEFVNGGTTLTFMRLNGVCVKVNDDGGFNHTITIPISDSDGIPFSENAWATYKQNELMADIFKSIVIAGTSAALIPATGGLSVVGAVTAGASFGGNIVKNQNLPDKQVVVSNNSFDLFPSVVPRLEVSKITTSTRELCASLWRRKGYPVKSLQSFDTRRFWYDYKQLNNATFTNITNPIARRKLEQAFNNGVTIWHQNGYINDVFIGATINDYSKNNVDIYEVEVSQ